MSPALSKEEQPGVFEEDAGPQKHTTVQNCMKAAHTGEASNRFAQAPCLSSGLPKPNFLLSLSLIFQFLVFLTKSCCTSSYEECLENINQYWF